MSIVAKSVVIACLLTGTPAIAAVRGPFTLEPVRAVAAHVGAIAAIVSTPAGPQVLLLTREHPGDPVTVAGRWPQAPTGVSPDDLRARARRSRSGSDLDDTLWLYDLTDADREAWFMEELLEQEGLDDGDGKPRRATSTAPPTPRALAAAATGLWMATSRGVWRLEGRGPSARWRPSGLDGRDVSQIDGATDDAGGLVLTALAGGTIWRSTDRGESWQPDSRPRSRPSSSPAPGGRLGRRGGRVAADVTAMAVADDEVWIGSRYGLFSADVEDDIDAWGAAGLLKSSTGLELSMLEDSPAASGRASWRQWIPRVAVAVGTSVRGDRSDLRAMIWITIPLQRARR